MATTAPKMGSKKIRVLIVDDSASVRHTLSDIISSDPELEVSATASDPYVAAERIRAEIPDVIFLDIEMPRMDGITFMRKIMAQRPIPVVVCSSLTEEGSDTLMRALEAGAVDVVTKPRVETAHFLQESRMLICDAAKAAAHAKFRGVRKAAPAMTVEAKLTADAMIPPLSASKAAAARAAMPLTDKIICVGASTGGTEALREFLEALPAESPAIVIVQHMPEKFTNAFARRLNAACKIEIKEAEDGDEVRPSRALIAPGNRHMLLRRSGRQYRVAIADGQYVSRHRPSVDVLFRSAAQCAGPNAVGVIMTGMGDDGAAGLHEMHQVGSYTIAQDEETCVVFGMPKEAIKLGGVDKVTSLQGIIAEINNLKQAA